ncbi:hypothetical protein NL676_017008 [Syzygium grande]|nr:hypothetical protein NL676_017008 [Syzygium grande]
MSRLGNTLISGGQNRKFGFALFSLYNSPIVPQEEQTVGVFTFVCRSSGDEWTAKQVSGDLEASAASSFELQRKLVRSAVAADSSGGFQSSFSLVTPSSAVFQ